MPRPLRIVIGLTGLVLVSIGCASDEAPASGMELRDSAGIQIVRASGADGSFVRSTAMEVVSIGALDGPPGSTFNRIADLAVGADGRVFVLDAGDYVVRAYERDGTFLFEVGGEGDGPSELRGPSRLQLYADTLAIFDTRAPKVVRYTVDGDFLDTHPVNMTVFTYGFPALWERVPGGGVMVFTTGCSMPAPEDRRPKWKLLTVDQTATVTDTVAILNSSHMLAVYGERFCSGLPALGGRRHSLAVRADGTAAYGDGSAYEIAIFALTAEGPDGYSGVLPAPTRIVRRVVDPARLDEAAIGSYRDRITTPPDGERPQIPGYLDAIEAAWDTVGFPVHHPYFDRLLWDDEDRLWVGRVVADDVERRPWDAMSEEGALLAEVTLPRELDVYVIHGGLIWGAVRDDLGVMYVKAYRLPGEDLTP